MKIARPPRVVDTAAGQVNGRSPPATHAKASATVTSAVARHGHLEPSMGAPTHASVRLGPRSGRWLGAAEGGGDVGKECTQRFAAVADRVLLGGRQLAVGQLLAVGDEDRVVAEAV